MTNPVFANGPNSISRRSTRKKGEMDSLPKDEGSFDSTGSSNFVVGETREGTAALGNFGVVVIRCTFSRATFPLAAIEGAYSPWISAAQTNRIEK